MTATKFTRLASRSPRELRKTNLAVLAAAVAVSVWAPTRAQASDYAMRCPNATARHHLVLHDVYARRVSCAAVDSILRRALLPPTASSFLRWGTWSRLNPRGWTGAPGGVFYTTVKNWDMADLVGSTEVFKSGDRWFDFTWGRVTRWRWNDSG
jgi:hypothetical protein